MRICTTIIPNDWKPHKNIEKQCYTTITKENSNMIC